MGMNLSKPPLCKGRCHGNAVTEGLLQSRGTTPQAAIAASSPCTGEPRSAPRRGLLLLLILAFLLASCTQAAPRSPQIPADFTATVEVARGDFTYTADYTRRGGSETLHFTAPDSLAGLSAARTDGGCTLSVGGVTAAVPDDGIFMPFALFDAPDGCLTCRVHRQVRRQCLPHRRGRRGRAGATFGQRRRRLGRGSRAEVYAKHPACGGERKRT